MSLLQAWGEVCIRGKKVWEWKGLSQGTPGSQGQLTLSEFPTPHSILGMCPSVTCPQALDNCSSDHISGGAWSAEVGGIFSNFLPLWMLGEMLG